MFKDKVFLHIESAFNYSTEICTSYELCRHLCVWLYCPYICFLFINPGKFVDETLIKMMIQFLQNEILKHK